MLKTFKKVLHPIFSFKTLITKEGVKLVRMHHLIALKLH